MALIGKLRHSATQVIAKLGPKNLLAQVVIRSLCRRSGVAVSFEDNLIKLLKGQQAILLASRHLLYAWEISKRFDVYFDSIIPKKENGFEVVDYSKMGTLQTYRETGLSFYMSSVPEELSAIKDYCRWYKPEPGELVFDVGAHCGFSTYYFSQMVGPAGKVVCFEPDPINYELLLRNIELHHLENVAPVQMAVAGSHGIAQFQSEANIGSALARCSSRGSLGNIVDVQTLTLTEAFDRWGVPRLCKMDIEGAEIEVLKAAAHTLRNLQVHFVLDTQHLVDGRLTRSAVEAIFTSIGYRVESSEQGMSTTWAMPVHDGVPSLLRSAL